MSSKVLAKSTDTAESRLIQAIQRFEAQLSSDQRKLYTQGSNSPPTSGDVSKLLGEVDKIVKSKHGTRRAFKPRLESVVMAIQKFASIGDIIIGGSQNLVACGVWSIARIALLAATSSLSTIQELSSLFMAVGSSAPYHEEIAVLFPHSTRLRTLIYEYHIVVVELRFAFSDQNYRAQLERWGDAISREIPLSIAKTLDKQASETSSFRSNVIRKFTDDKHSQQERAKYKILKACSTYEYRSSLQLLQKTGTAEFFLSEPAYLNWRAKKKTTLTISGKLGAGKSVLAASIIADLTASNQNGTSVCYFFCRHDIPQSLLAQTIAGTLCRQILGHITDISKWSKLLASHIPPFNIKAMTSLIVDVIDILPDSGVCLVVDGLDECEKTEQAQLFEFLTSLQHFGICITYRSQASLPHWANGWSDQSHLSIPEKNPDIQRVIYSELARRLENGLLKLNDPTLIEKIYMTLYDGSNGMFLWATLMIDCICYEETDERIRHTLTKLPKTLPELYARILSRAAQDDAYHDQDRIFRLILAAFRLLKKEELGEALGVTPGDLNYDPDRRINDMDRLLSRCASLVVVDEEYHTVQLVHQSARTYLMADHVSTDGLPMDKESLHQAMADTAITYLGYGIFDRQISSNVVTPISAAAVPQSIIESTLQDSKSKRVALKLLKTLRGADFDLAPLLDSHGTATDTTLYDQQVTHPFYHYAKEYFAAHALFYNPDEQAWRSDVLSMAISRKEDVTFNTITAQLSSTWESCSINDLAIVAFRWTETYQEFRRLLTQKDVSGRDLMTWCVYNFPHLAKSYWTKYTRLCLNSGITLNQYRLPQETDQTISWFLSAVEEANYELASAFYEAPMWSYLIEEGFFHLRLKTLWIASNFKAVKWIGEHIAEREIDFYKRRHAKDSKLDSSSFKSDKETGRPINTTKPALQREHMVDWHESLSRAQTQAVVAFCFVISVPMLHCLCKIIQKRTATSFDSDGASNIGQVVSRLKFATSRPISLKCFPLVGLNDFNLGLLGSLLENLDETGCVGDRRVMPDVLLIKEISGVLEQAWCRTEPAPLADPTQHTTTLDTCT